MAFSKHCQPNQHAGDEKDHAAARGGFEQKRVGARANHTRPQNEGERAFFGPSRANDAQRQNCSSHEKGCRVVAVREKTEVRGRENIFRGEGVFPAGLFGVDRHERVGRTTQRAEEGDVDFHTGTHRVPQRKQPREQRPGEEHHPINRLARGERYLQKRRQTLVFLQADPPRRRVEPRLRQEGQRGRQHQPAAEHPIPPGNHAIRGQKNHCRPGSG